MWFTFIFLPAFPLRRIELCVDTEAGDVPVARCAVLSERRLTAREVARTYVWGIAALLGVAASWSAAYLNAANTSLPGGLGVLVGGVAPLALAAWLDERLPRITVIPMRNGVIPNERKLSMDSGPLLGRQR